MKISARFLFSIVLAVLLAALLLPGCSKTPEEHARIAVDRSAGFEQRMASVQALNDEALLVKVVIGSGVSGKTTYQNEGNAVIVGDDLRILHAAAGRISNRRLLSDSVAKVGNVFLRIEVAVLLNDGAALRRCVEYFSSSSAEPSVLDKLSNQRMLAELVRGSRDSAIRLGALGKLTDQNLLADIARQNEDGEVRQQAVSRLTDQNALADIAKTHKDGETAREAIQKLDEQSLLAVVASSRHAEVRAGAVEKIQDPQALDSLARNGAEPVLRLLAVWRLTDRTRLSDLAENAPDESVRQVAADKLSGKTQDTGRGEIMDLINERKLLAEINGGGIQKLNVRFWRAVPYPLEVTIPAGSYFIGGNTDAQNMVSTEEVSVMLTGNSASESIPVACANMRKKIPTRNDSFTLSTLPKGGELAKLMALLGEKSVFPYTSQAAVWIVTDNADYGDLGTLVRRTASIPIPTRAINESIAAEAMRLCHEAGIDIKKKAIWRDRAEILRGMLPIDLKNWLRTFSGAARRK